MSFKVAVLADPSSAAGFWGGEYGIQVYDLSADQICSILQSPEHSNGIDVAKLGVAPVNKYELYGGGRFFPSVTREELAQVMQGVDVMLIGTDNHPFAMNYMTTQFIDSLISENLLDQCKAMILRVTTVKEGDRFLSKSTKPLALDAILAKSGLNKASHLQSKLYVVADNAVKRGKKRSSKSKKKKMEEADAAAVVARLRARLLGEEVKEMVTAPVKETLTAGKAMLQLGQRLSSWVSSLVKS